MSKHHWSTIRYRPQTSNPRYVISRVSKYRQRVEQGLEDYRLKPLQDEFESAMEDAEQGMPFTLERIGFFFGNNGLGMELWDTITGISGFDD